MNIFKKRLIINLAITITIILTLLLITWYLAFDTNKRISAIQEARGEQRFRSEAIQALASLKKDFQQAQIEKLSLSTGLPIQDRLIDLPKDINNFAKQNSVNVEFSFGQEKAGDEINPGYITFTITASAPFDNWLNFIKMIENSHYFISFDSFNLVKDDKIFKSVINGKAFSQ